MSKNDSQAALSSSSTVIPIQPKGNQRPFFCLPGAGSHVLTFQPLAQALGTSQPFYGLQPPGLEAETLPLSRMSELVSLFESALLDMGHHGPIDLGGHSAGGVIAFALAVALQKRGVSGPRLAIFDSLPPRKAAISDNDSLSKPSERQVLLDLIEMMSQALGTELSYSAQESKILAKECRGQEHGAVTNHGKNDTTTATHGQACPCVSSVFFMKHVPDPYNSCQRDAVRVPHRLVPAQY